MQVTEDDKSELRAMMALENEIEDYDKEQLCQLHKEIKQQLIRFKPQSLAVFEEWVTQIYKLKVKITDLGLEGKNIEFSISTADIEGIVNRVLLETCQLHRHLIDEQLRAVREMAVVEGFYKIDADEPGLGYFDHPAPAGEGIKMDAPLDPTLHSNQQYYGYCVWVIYNHYCSLTECNELVCELSKLFHETSQNLFLRIFKEIEKKKSSGEIDGQGSVCETLKNRLADNNSSEVRQIVSMVEDEEVLKLTQLNILTIVNLIPKSIPVRRVEGRERNTLYWHICSFETTINSIVYDNRQNMRRFVVFLRNFKKAIQMLKSRLSRQPGRLFMVDDKGNQIPAPVRNRKWLNHDLINEQFISSQIEKKIDNERVLGSVYIEDDDKAKYDEAELVKNIDELLEKERPLHRIEKQKAYEMSAKRPREMAKKTGKHQFTFKNSNYLETPDNIESITRISAMLTESNMESYKFQVVVKKNEKNAKKGEPIRDDQFAQKKKRIDLQLSELKGEKNLQKEIVEELKNNLNSLIKSQLTKQEQFANYLKMTERHDKGRRSFKFDEKPQSCELNLHEFIQQSDFKNDDEESEADENYLERMEQQHLQNQRKKKKKKNKKKKNQKEEPNPMQSLQSQKSNQKSNSQNICEPPKSNLIHEVCQKQYEVIKALESTKIDKENRMKCFDVQEESLITMSRRQMEMFDKSMFRSQGSLSKNKKGKKQKAK